MKIRFATQTDASSLLEIYARYVLTTPASFELEAPTLEDFSGRMKTIQARFPWLVAETEEGQIAGYTYAGPHRSRGAYEWSVESTVYLAPSHHGKGLGTKLYQELFRLLKAQGVVNVFAGITLPNDASVRLHESLGFALIGSFRDVGFKQGQWCDVGWWQLQFQKPQQEPRALQPY